MELTILGSGGCMTIPKPLCRCRVCEEARTKGVPYARTGPSVFLHDENLLIDTPAEIGHQLNRSGIDQIDHLLFTHLDPDHVEGFRVVEQATIDFRTWKAYPNQSIKVTLPEKLDARLDRIQSVYGPLIEFYEQQGFVERRSFDHEIHIGRTHITAVSVDRGPDVSFIYLIEKEGRKIIYAPCDIKPFPERRSELQGADLLIIQPGIFEDGLPDDFVYDDNHVSRTTLYTFEETVALTKRLEAGGTLFVHLEEYWNRSHDDYVALERNADDIRFAYDGMQITV
jgi:phosphoribosyl 1,2-cyclic phosphate phosphodiesterase